MVPRTSHDPIPPGTLEVLVLTALARRDELHGFEIAEAIERASTDVLRVEEGSLYPALQRMLVKGWIVGEWRRTEENRRVRYYRLTATGGGGGVSTCNEPDHTRIAGGLTMLRRLWFFVTRWRRVQELDEKMRLHVDLCAAANRRHGVHAEETARQARTPHPQCRLGGRASIPNATRGAAEEQIRSDAEQDERSESAGSDHGAQLIRSATGTSANAHLAGERQARTWRVAPRSYPP